MDKAVSKLKRKRLIRLILDVQGVTPPLDVDK